MSWLRKTQEEKAAKLLVNKSKVEKLIDKEAGALKSLQYSLCLNDKGVLYLFCYCEFNMSVDKLAYIVQYETDYANKTTQIYYKGKDYPYSDSKWLEQVVLMIAGDRARYQKMKSDLLTFGVQIINKKEKENEKENTTGSESSNAGKETSRDISTPLAHHRV